MNTPPTPQHDKARPLLEKMHDIGQFIEWLNQEKSWRVCELGEREYSDYWFPVGMGEGRINELLAEFYGIDYKVYLAEKDAILQAVREHSGLSS